MRIHLNSEQPLEAFLSLARRVVDLGYWMLHRNIELPGGDGTITDEEARTFGKVLHGTAVRMIRNCDAVFALAERNFGEQALMVVRSMWESALHLQYIAAGCESPWRRAKLYLDFVDVYRGQIVRSARQNPNFDASQAVLSDPAYVSSVDQAYSDVEADFPNKHRWTAASIRDMAQELGRLDEYLFLYGPLCQETHGSSVALIEQFVKAEDGRWVYSGGRYRREALGLASNYLLQVLGVYEVVFQASLPEQCRAQITALRHELDALITLPGLENQAE